MMARPLRIEYPGAIYHITSRGNAASPIFQDDDDRRELLAILGEVIRRFNWVCHAYCLMDTHYHLLLETLESNLSYGMRHLNGVYTQRFNRRHKRPGHVFQGRFKSILVERESYLLELCRYVVLNPVRAGQAKSPAEFPWSSYLATAGRIKKGPSFLTIDWILSQFSEDRTKAKKEYQKFVSEGIFTSSPLKEAASPNLLGPRSFIERLKPALQGKTSVKEIPRLERFSFRPPLRELLGRPAQASQEERDRAIFSAHFEYGYKLCEIAGVLNLHYTTISKIIDRQRNK